MFQILILLSLFQVYEVSSETVNYTIADGPINCIVTSTAANNVTYHACRGIPYAQPPLGNLRFAAPQKNFPWTDILDATQDKDECVQYNTYIGTTVYGQEDCLYINVYTTKTNTSSTAKLPVLVWIYGGGFAFGNSSFRSYGPESFLESGVIFVSFNYRVGIFGFLSTEDEVCPGNWGIKDQILALKWVQTNIGYFGGDSKNVTIFGESAGAVSVAVLLQANGVTGLFHKAIMNSGTTLNLWSLSTRALEIAVAVSTAAGVIAITNADRVAGLRKIDAYRLQRISTYVAYPIFLTNAFRGVPWAVVLEPRTVAGAVFTNASDDALVAGKFRRVPILMGFNSNEAASISGLPGLLKLYFLKYNVLTKDLTPWSLTTNEATRVIVGNRIKEHYFGLTLIPFADTLDLFLCDDEFNRPIRRAAQDMSQYVNVYFYVFGYETGLESYKGVAHADDLDYFFSARSQSQTPVAKTMVKLWSQFAISGNPTPVADSALNNTIWLPVNYTSSNFNYLAINASISMQVNPRQSGWTFYQSMFSTYGDGSYTTY